MQSGYRWNQSEVYHKRVIGLCQMCQAGQLISASDVHDMNTELLAQRRLPSRIEHDDDDEDRKFAERDWILTDYTLICAITNKRKCCSRPQVIYIVDLILRAIIIN